MGKKKGRSLKDQAWAEAKKRHRLAVRHVKMDTVGLLIEGMRRVDEFRQTGRWMKDDTAQIQPEPGS